MKKLKLNYYFAAAAAIIFITEIIIALFVRDKIIRPYAGDILAVMLIWCSLRIFLPPYRFLPLLVFMFAAAVEFAQLLDLTGRLGLRSGGILATALGSTFDAADLICYAIGAAAAWGWQLLYNYTSNKNKKRGK